jgi:hypothetical protein
MKHIVTVQEAVTAFAAWLEPTDAELDAIDSEMPLIAAEVELLDVQIGLLDQPVTETDTRRLRRAHRKVLATCLAVTNRAASVSGVAA